MMNTISAAAPAGTPRAAALLLLVLGLFAAAPAAGQQLGEQRISRDEFQQGYRARRDSVIRFWADGRGAGYMKLAAKLQLREDVDWVAARLDSILAHPPSGDMFWMYPFISVTFEGRHLLPDDIRRRMRDQWRTYFPFRGDTENHWAMYYTALYLITQMYPDEPPTAWYNGRSSQENFEEARDYLLHWMDLTTTIGQGEYDSPDYYGVYMVPMAQLYAYADDPAMKQRARMMLDYLVADFAAESLNGLYVGAHSRTYPQQVEEQWVTASTGFAHLLFGNIPYYPRGETLPFALSGYEPPEILYQIATDRSAPYVHRELKRTRHRVRHSDVRNAPVYKYDYIRREYAVGSSQGGLLQPIQQHTWDVTWAVDDPRGARNTLFTIHPYSSPIEGTMYFSETPEMVTELIVRSKTTFDSPDKWTGGSPYEQVFQHEDAVVALYDIPAGTRFPQVSGFFPKTLARREVDASGWIFARGGDALIAYYPLAPYTWREEEHVWRLHSAALKNGAVVQVAAASEFPDFEAFKAAVRALPIETRTAPTPSVRFRTLRGADLAFTYGGTPSVDGRAVDYDRWPLFDGPFLRADRGSRTLEIRYGPHRRLLDFNTLTIRDWVEDGNREPGIGSR